MISLFRRKQCFPQGADLRSQDLIDAGIELEWRRRVARNPKERARVRRDRYPQSRS